MDVFSPDGRVLTRWTCSHPMNMAPDVVVEVLSPTETASELEEKLRDYRAAETRLAWIVDPTARILAR